jgi:hypothetical protein
MKTKEEGGGLKKKMGCRTITDAHFNMKTNSIASTIVLNGENAPNR